MEVGEVWAYREKTGAPVVPVELIRIGTKRPPHVRIRHLQEESEGREEWVSPARLKVLWTDVEHWLAREQRWQAVRDASCHIRDTAEDWAVTIVFGELPNPDLFDHGYNRDTGILMVPDVDALVAELGIDREVLTGDPLSFTDDDGRLIASWSVTRQVAEHVARRYADRILEEVAKDEERDRQEAIYGDYIPRQRGEDIYFSPETCAKVAKERRPAYDLVRKWCGVTGLERYDELAALRVEVVRLGKLVERAITLLRNAGHSGPADGLERDLGIPIEALRRTKLPDQ